MKSKEIEQALNTIEDVKKEVEKLRKEYKTDLHKNFCELANRVSLLQAENKSLKEKISLLEQREKARIARMKESMMSK